jgi:hypothetical protein
MRAFALALLAISGLASAGPSFFPESLTLPDGKHFCCDKRYASCEESCRQKCLGVAGCQPAPECLAKCREDRCRPGKGACGAAADSREGSVSVDTFSPSTARAKGGDMSLRHDGQVTGPGTIRFEIDRSGATLPPLAVYGIVFGTRQDSGQVEVLAKSDTRQVLAGKATRFTMDVSPENFEDWTKRCTKLTVAIALPTERDRQRWTYRNLLTQDDAEKAKDGQMRVKGEFVWTGMSIE